MSRNLESAEKVIELVAHLLSENKASEAERTIFQYGTRCPEISNAYGVCLMRTGDYAKALETYRNLCIDNTGVSLRRDRPALYHVNYATCLLLNQNAAGCESVLREINQAQHPSVVKLRSSLWRWRSTLSWLERVKLSIFGINPSKPIQLDYPPGDLSDADAPKIAA